MTKQQVIEAMKTVREIRAGVRMVAGNITYLKVRKSEVIDMLANYDTNAINARVSCEVLYLGE